MNGGVWVRCGGVESGQTVTRHRPIDHSHADDAAKAKAALDYGAAIDRRLRTRSFMTVAVKNYNSADE